MKFLQYPLWPFSLLYAGITRSRNWLYDRKLLTSTQFAVPVISVGNLTVGGTGKTPHVEYLVRLLAGKNIAILSRGYKRQTTGFVLADAQASALTIGDEPFQYYQEFPEVTVAVCEYRVFFIQHLLKIKPDLDLVLLDDAYQHRPVKAHLNILITDYSRLFYQDQVLPAGRLREGRSGANRADAVIVSKCPGILNAAEQDDIKANILKYTGRSIPVFFTYYTYQNPVPFGNAHTLSKNIILVTGIAKAEPLVHYLKATGYQLQKHFNFPDHYAYTQQDMQEISNFAGSIKEEVSILTTQKDWTKLINPTLQPITASLPWFYLPIRVVFKEDQALFDEMILKTAVQ